MEVQSVQSCVHMLRPLVASSHENIPLPASDIVCKSMLSCPGNVCLNMFGLQGPPGTGKTTSVLCLARALLGTSYKEGVLELNASDDRCSRMPLTVPLAAVFAVLLADSILYFGTCIPCIPSL